MTEYMARDGYYMSYAIGTDLTQWDNAQAALVVGESNAIDWFIGASVTHTKPKTVSANPMSSGRYPKRITVGRVRGKVSNTHFLQTGIYTYAVMGVSTAVGAGVERDITVDTDTTPISIAFHYEKEGTTANRRKDCMGVVPRQLAIACSENQPIARQTYMGEFAFTGAGGDLAEPTKLTQADFAPYNWYNYKNASGASAFTYGGGAINVDIVGLTINFGWDQPVLGTYDGNGYPTNGQISPPFTTSVVVDCKYKDAGGTDIQAISDLDPQGSTGYAGGDLDLVVDFYQSSSRYLKYTFDKMCVDPESFEEMFQSEGDWFDGFQFTLNFLNESSSLAVKTKDALADTYYTNP